MHHPNPQDNDPYVDCFFIRRKNWAAISDLAEEAGLDESMMEGIQEDLLKTYVEKIHLPIQDYQEALNYRLYKDNYKK